MEKKPNNINNSSSNKNNKNYFLSKEKDKKKKKKSHKASTAVAALLECSKKNRIIEPSKIFLLITKNITKNRTVPYRIVPNTHGNGNRKPKLKPKPKDEKKPQQQQHLSVYNYTDIFCVYVTIFFLTLDSYKTKQKQQIYL